MQDDPTAAAAALEMAEPKSKQRRPRKSAAAAQPADSLAPGMPHLPPIRHSMAANIGTYFSQVLSSMAAGRLEEASTAGLFCRCTWS